MTVHSIVHSVVHEVVHVHLDSIAGHAAARYGDKARAVHGFVHFLPSVFRQICD